MRAHLESTLARLASEADEQALFDLLMALHWEGLGRIFPYDYGKVIAAIQHGTRRRGGIIGVIDAPDRSGYLAGSVGLTTDEWWWSRDAFLQERWLFVRQEYRHGTDYFSELKRFSEECREQIDNDPSKRQTSPFVLESSFVEDNPRQVRLKERLWGRWGRKIGGVFISGL